jgi:NAD(P)-dependent dehydrogenase (short-subunit alcohol dehydrogenase family)
MKIFLTGGSGYSGQETIAELVRQGHVVEALARSDGAAEIVASRGARPVTGTLSDLDVLTESARKADAVIHLAQADTGDADLAAANAMLDGVGSGTYVHTGGTWVYGDTDGIGGTMPTAKEVASAVSTGAGLDGRAKAITLEEARAQMGPIADAFALDQQLSSAKARAELNWRPTHDNPLVEFAAASR